MTDEQPRGGVAGTQAPQTQQQAGEHAGLPATGWLTVAELAARRGASEMRATGTWLAARRLNRELIVIAGPDDVLQVPAFQLTDDGDPRPELRQVLAELLNSGVGDRTAWTWLTSPSSYLSGDVPEQVARVDPKRAATAAARFAAR